MTDQKVSLVVVATGRYVEFLPALLAGAEKHVRGLDRIFVISDSRPAADNRVTWLPWGHLPWPYPTLLRYRAITAYASELRTSEVLLYVDVDMRFERELILPGLSGLLAVEHPGYGGVSVECLPYERRQASLCCVPEGLGSTYFAGGVQGGQSAEYLRACLTLAEWIQADLEREIIPQWHDESAWNRLLVSTPPQIALSAAYCAPESSDISGAFIVALDKDHDRMRSVPLHHRIARKASLWQWRLKAKVVQAAKSSKRRST